MSNEPAETSDLTRPLVVLRGTSPFPFIDTRL